MEQQQWKIYNVHVIVSDFFFSWNERNYHKNLFTMDEMRRKVLSKDDKTFGWERENTTTINSTFLLKLAKTKTINCWASERAENFENESSGLKPWEKSVWIRLFSLLLGEVKCYFMSKSVEKQGLVLKCTQLSTATTTKKIELNSTPFQSFGHTIFIWIIGVVEYQLLIHFFQTEMWEFEIHYI